MLMCNSKNVCSILKTIKTFQVPLKGGIFTSSLLQEHKKDKSKFGEKSWQDRTAATQGADRESQKSQPHIQPVLSHYLFLKPYVKYTMQVFLD